MHCITLDIGIRDISIHMEVDTIPSNNLRLTTVSELCVGNMRNHAILIGTNHHQMRSILIFNWCGITHHLYISGEKAYFCSDFQWNRSKCFRLADMLIVEGRCEGDCLPRNTSNLFFLGLIIVVICWSNDYFFTCHPIYIIFHRECQVSSIDGCT